MKKQNLLLESALKYASLGFSVFPLHTPTNNGGCSCNNPKCDKVGKHPRTLNGLKDATTDENQIKQWWEKWSDANIGLVTGSISRFFSLDADIDKKTGEKIGEEELKKHPSLPETINFDTGSGGKQFLFSYPKDKRIGNKVKFLPGLDIRGEGGYIVAPPSLHASGKKYKWNNGHILTKHNFAECPSWLFDAIHNNKKTTKKTSANNGDKIPESERNDTLFRYACSLREKRLSEEEITFLIKTKNETKCQPKLDELEVMDLIKSALSYSNDNDDEWQDPIPFDDYSNLPVFPTEILPEIGREMVETVSKVNQVDRGLPGSMYLAALSTCLSKKVQVDLGTHTEPVNIYTCPILDPGERKTSTMNLMMAPVYEYQKEKTGEVIGDDNEPPVYIVDDITAEALFKLMTENNERMSVISAEGGIFGIMAGRYNSNGNGNIDVYLKGHAGDPCSNHRISRKSQSMDSPCLTISLAVQRDIIKEIGSNRQFRGRGLLGRFLYCNCVHKAGYRERQEESMPEVLIQEYGGHILELIKMPLSIHNLKLSPEAQATWDEFYNDIETDMQPGKQMASMKDWGSKLPGAVARIAGLLHFAEYGKEAMSKPISVNIVNASAAIGAYYREHALATFGLMRENPEIESAKRILEYIMLHKPDKFTGRDVLRHKNAIKTMAEVTPGLKLLIERNYIREIRTGVFEVNPIIKTL